MRCWCVFVVLAVVNWSSVFGVGVPYSGGRGTVVGGSDQLNGLPASSTSFASRPSGPPGLRAAIGTTITDSDNPAGQPGVGIPFSPAASESAAAGGSFTGFSSGARPASASGVPFAGLSGDGTFSGFSGSGARDGATFPRGTSGQSFVTSVIQEHVTPTVTQTVTIDTFTTLTDIVFQSYGVTLTQFVVKTATRPLQQAVVTPVDDVVAISTTVVHRPEYITLTETKSDFRLAVRTSVTHFTLTHTSYAITHVPFTITATETVHLTSLVVTTVISTHRQVVTDFRTLVNTVYIHGGGYY